LAESVLLDRSNRKLEDEVAVPDQKKEPESPTRDRSEDDETPDTPPTEPAPVPVEEPPGAPGTRGPYVVA
jgi:hypothetical protein